jgi:2-keto-4-pentenoate hydratase/2-oxohepta-3-ene-1,7-dioic acid hydratase in catechol pathway
VFADVPTSTGLRPGTFGIAAFGAGAPRTALVLPDGGVVDVSDLYPSTRAVFEQWDAAFPALADAARDRAPRLRFDDLRPLPPLDRPDLLCAGSNYVTHVAQMLTKNTFNQHNRRPGETDEQFFQRNYDATLARRQSGTPFLWTGMHSSLIGAHDDIVLPELGDQPDWELELGVVVGHVERYSTIAEAQASIAGYVILNDLGTVDVFRRTDIHFGFDWISKNQPTFKPLGPFIVPAAFVDVSDLTIRLSLNGEVMQDWPADDFLFGPAELVAYASERVRLLPGDVIAMGSPPGNGAHHGGRFLRDGDLVESEITGLGRQRNRCVAEDLHGRTPVFGHWTNAPEELAVRAGE